MNDFPHPCWEIFPSLATNLVSSLPSLVLGSEEFETKLIDIINLLRLFVKEER
jgi:hypothetical protein